MSSRQNQSRVMVTLDGVVLGQWDDKTGGDTDSNSVQYFLGGMGPSISLGGSAQVNNVVLMKLEDADILARAKWIIGRVGKGKAAATQQKLDDEGNPVGEPFQWVGKLKRFKLADVQSQQNAPAVCEMEIEVDGLPA